jgi:hypothetical protein
MDRWDKAGKYSESYDLSVAGGLLYPYLRLDSRARELSGKRMTHIVFETKSKVKCALEMLPNANALKKGSGSATRCEAYRSRRVGIKVAETYWMDQNTLSTGFV